KTNNFIHQKPKLDTNNIIVIPAYNEPNIINALNSIKECTLPEKSTEVIIIINSSINSPQYVIEQNKKTETEINNWSKINNNEKIVYHPILLEKIPSKTAGVGYARKVGMDEAINRFILIKNTFGFITNLDADSLVKKNYLVELENLFLTKPKTKACSIYFEHPIKGVEFPEVIYKKIIEYELYLRYYSLSLKYTGFPNYYHTVGSSFAVKAETYCKQGGMNTKQAGEDFYFLQKLMPLGRYEYLKSTTVYPSPRSSDRVIFGTGAYIKSSIENPKTNFFTYNFNAFKTLKNFFSQIDKFYKLDAFNYELFNLHESINKYLKENEFEKALKEINSNTSNLQTFRKRFFRWFDALKILKYLNYSHNIFFEKQQLIEVLNDYLTSSKIKNINISDNKSLLIYIRNLEKRLT
ncbi:MAG: glycosyltransferase family 2 protein, partial [Bacteroidales bacterium]|nr:glycosyltransferase family 2 protein [Bacteroidales bacterium]